MFKGVSYDYSGATVLITGGTSGIGLGCAHAYRNAGAEVIERIDAIHLGKGFALDFGVRHLSAHPPAMVLIVATYMPPAGFIKKAAKHPMLLAVKIWALAHLIANWDLASVILFGSFLIYGVVDRIAVKRRGDVGAANIKPNVLGDLLSIAVGLALYLLFIYEVHYMLIGVDVLAG